MNDSVNIFIAKGGIGLAPYHNCSGINQNPDIFIMYFRLIIGFWYFFGI